MASLFITLLLVMLFYFLIPGIGGLYARNQWRLFRKRIVQSSLYPRVTYALLRTSTEGYMGKYRFFGILEAIQGERIWIKNRNTAVSADLTDCPVYVLPSLSINEDEDMVEQNREILPDEEPEKISWNKIFSLPEGTKILISGSLFKEEGRPVFRSGKNRPLTVVIYDGPEETILRRSIWTGRQKNEYWNMITPGSITAGSFSLFIQTYILFRTPMLRFQALVALTASLLPVIVFVPPGILFFFLYRRLWRRGRILRAERDLLQLPLRFFPDPGDHSYQETSLPDGETIAMLRVSNSGKLPLHAVEGRIKMRKSVLLEQYGKPDSQDYYIFGSPVQQGDTSMVEKPGDPMAEFLIIPGNPASLSAECARRAHLFELAAVAVFSIGLAMNISLVFFLLSVIIK